MFIVFSEQKSLAPEERHLRVADAAPPELETARTRSINIALLRSERPVDLCRCQWVFNPRLKSVAAKRRRGSIR